ncbi:hypothetical protein ACIGJO_31835 [Streptomyces sp. NPDC079020]
MYEMVETAMISPALSVRVTDDIHEAHRTFRRTGIRRPPVLAGIGAWAS